jgi:hypothetical protein
MSCDKQTIFENKELYGVCENIAEISSQFIAQLQEMSKEPRNAIIGNYIVPWAIEAENAYSAMSDEERDELPYFDFIDAFTIKKIKEAFGENALLDCPPITVEFKL